MVRIDEHMERCCECKQLDHQAAEMNVAGYCTTDLFRRLEEIDVLAFGP